MKILVVEDDHDLATNIAEYLEPKGMTLDFAYDGITGLHLAVTQNYDAIILDIGLPGINGYEFCEKLRQEAKSPVALLMLTARDTLEDKIQGFEVGTDDYLVKPFALPELYHRLLALTRRRSGKTLEQQLQVADLILDEQTRFVCRAGRAIKLNRINFRILRLLMMHSPRLVSKEKLLQEIWGEQETIDNDVMRSHIYQLRQAIDKPFAIQLLHTVHSEGYLLKVPNHEKQL